MRGLSRGAPVGEEGLRGLEGGFIDDGRVCVADDNPVVWRHGDGFLAFVAELALTALHHVPQIHLVGQDFADGVGGPDAVRQAVLPCVRRVVGKVSCGFVCGGGGDAAMCQACGDFGATIALQVQAENLTNNCGGFFVDGQFVSVLRVLDIAKAGKTAQILAVQHFGAENGADVLGQVLTVPFVDEAVDLACLFAALHACVHMVNHADEADAPQHELMMQVSFDKLHVARKAGLVFAKDDVELPRLCVLQERIESGAVAVEALAVVIAVDFMDCPVVLDGVFHEQELLVLDAGAVVALVELDLVFLGETAVDGDAVLGGAHGRGGLCPLRMMRTMARASMARLSTRGMSL